ncbi:MAG: efflux RND transporter periplasmic adaptor subunit [Candidatus Binatia bacterium]
MKAAYNVLAAALLMAGGCSRPSEGTKGPDATAAPARVEVTRPERRDVARTITLSASVEAFEQAPVCAKVGGYVDRIIVDIGDRVTEGQVLATLDIPEMADQSAQAEQQLAQQQAEVTKAEAEAALQKTISARSQGLRAKDAITEQDLDEARAGAAKARAELELARARGKSAEARVAELRALMQYATLRAPFAGIVTRRFVDRGALVQASSSNNSPLLIVARTDTVRVFADVPEPDVSFISRGDRAVLAVAALPGRAFAGQITRFAEALEPSSRTMRTEVDLPNPDGTLRAGMYGTVTIAVETHPDALTVPEAAVRREKTRAVVYAVDGDRSAERIVKAGLAAEGRVEILEGLGDGDRVITSGAIGLGEGAPVQVVEAPRTGATP